jgi:hypothetical protein
MPVKRNWFTDMVTGLFDLISTGKPRVDAVIRAVIATAVGLSIILTAVTYISGFAVGLVDGVGGYATTVMGNKEVSLDTIDASVTGAVAAVGSVVNNTVDVATASVNTIADALGDAADVVSATETSWVSDAVNSVVGIFSPSEVAVTADTGSDVPVIK